MPSVGELLPNNIKNIKNLKPRRSGKWFEAAAFAALAWGADLNNDRYFLPAFAEAVANQTFDSAAGWTLGTGWAVSGGTLNATAVATGNVASFPTTITAGKFYQVTFTISAFTVGGVSWSVGAGTPDGTSRNAVGTYTEFFTAVGNSSALQFIRRLSDFTGSIDNVFVREINLTPVGRTYGPELIDNGDMSAAGVADPALGWVLGTAGGTSTSVISGGVLTITGDGTNTAFARQSIDTTGVALCEFTFTIAGGTMAMTVGTTQDGAQVMQNAAANYAAGIHTVKFVPQSNTSWLRFSRSGAGAVTIDNVTIKPLLAIGTYPKRAATFAEFFAFAAASDAARTYTDQGGVIRSMAYSRTNYPLNSGDFAQASWTKRNGFTVTVDAGAAKRDGTLGAQLFTFPTNAADIFSNTITGLLAGYRYEPSFYIKKVTAAGICRLQDSVGGNGSWNIDLSLVGSDWERITRSHPAVTIVTEFVGSSAGSLGLHFVNHTNINNLQFYAADAQLEFGRETTDYKASGAAAYQAGVNAPRWTWINGKRQFRAENAGTNLGPRSEELDNAVWTKPAATVVANAITSPSGTLTADKLVEDSTNAVHYAHHASLTTIPGAGTYTASVYLKAGERTWAWVYVESSARALAYFNLATGAVGNVTGTGTPAASIQSVGNGWYRCILTAVTTAATTFGWGLASANGTQSYQGDGVSGAYMGGAQAEQNAFATDYIPTAAAAVTRAIETAQHSAEVQALIQRVQGTIVVRAQNTPRNGGRYVGISGGAALLMRNGGAMAASNDGGTTVSSGATIDYTTSFAGVMGFDAAGRSVTGSGATLGSDANAPGTRTAVYLARDAATNYGDGYYDFIGGSPERLPNSNLQALAVAA